MLEGFNDNLPGGFTRLNILVRRLNIFQVEYSQSPFYRNIATFDPGDYLGGGKTSQREQLVLYL